MTTSASVRAAATDNLPLAALVPLAGTLAYQMDGIFIGATATSALRNTMAIALAVFLGSAELLAPRFGNGGLWAAFLLFMAARGAAQAVALPRIERGLPVSAPASR